MPFFADNMFDDEDKYRKLLAAIDSVKERATFPKELFELVEFFFTAPESFADSDLKKRWKEDTPRLLTELAEILRTLPSLDDEQATEESVKQWCEAKGYSLGAVMNPLRLVLVGQMKGPHIFTITRILGKTETLNRINSALKIIEKI